MLRSLEVFLCTFITIVRDLQFHQHLLVLCFERGIQRKKVESQLEWLRKGLSTAVTLTVGIESIIAEKMFYASTPHFKLRG